MPQYLHTFCSADGHTWDYWKPTWWATRSASPTVIHFPASTTTQTSDEQPLTGTTTSQRISETSNFICPQSMLTVLSPSTQPRYKLLSSTLKPICLRKSANPLVRGEKFKRHSTRHGGRGKARNVFQKFGLFIRQVDLYGMKYVYVESRCRTEKNSVKMDLTSKLKNGLPHTLSLPRALQV